MFNNILCRISLCSNQRKELAWNDWLIFQIGSVWKVYRNSHEKDTIQQRKWRRNVVSECNICRRTVILLQGKKTKQKRSHCLCTKYFFKMCFQLKKWMGMNWYFYFCGFCIQLLWPEFEGTSLILKWNFFWNCQKVYLSDTLSIAWS